MSSELSIGYTLKPRRVGNLKIEPATIVVNGKKMKTERVTVEVLQNSDNLQNGGSREEAFVRAVPSEAEAFVGQQIILDYKLYTQVDIDSYNVLEESGYPGFYAEDVRRYDFRAVKELVNGVEYTTKVIKRVALFPQQSGTLTIDPLHIQLGIVEGNNRRSNSFFFNKKVKRMPVLTDELSIKVKPLPPDAPPSFSGAVGDFQISTSVNRGNLTTDDGIKFSIFDNRGWRYQKGSTTCNRPGR